MEINELTKNCLKITYFYLSRFTPILCSQLVKQLVERIKTSHVFGSPMINFNNNKCKKELYVKIVN